MYTHPLTSSCCLRQSTQISEANNLYHSQGKDGTLQLENPYLPWLDTQRRTWTHSRSFIPGSTPLLVLYSPAETGIGLRPPLKF